MSILSLLYFICLRSLFSLLYTILATDSLAVERKTKLLETFRMRPLLLLHDGEQGASVDKAKVFIPY